MSSALPNNPRLKPSPAPQLLCSQDFARNPFGFIDLAGTSSARLNPFKNLGGIASFFSGAVNVYSLTQTSQRS
jgi:hypothetical protein